MVKTVVASYLTAQGFLYYILLLLQSVPADVIDVVTETDNTLSLFHLEHPALGVLGQIIYVAIVWHRKLSLIESGETVKTWSRQQTQMLGIRIFLSAVFSAFASVILIKVGANQDFVNMPAGLGELGIYIVDIAIGYFIIRGTKIEFENKVAEKLSDKMKI